MSSEEAEARERVQRIVAEAIKGQPTLAEIRSWPAAVSITVAATAYGISRSHAYELASRGEFPARTIRAGSRWVVVTAEIIRQLSASERGADAA